jgi:hypothetical protein
VFIVTTSEIGAECRFFQVEICQPLFARIVVTQGRKWHLTCEVDMETSPPLFSIGTSVLPDTSITHAVGLGFNRPELLIDALDQFGKLRL